MQKTFFLMFAVKHLLRKKCANWLWSVVAFLKCIFSFNRTPFRNSFPLDDTEKQATKPAVEIFEKALTSTQSMCLGAFAPADRKITINYEEKHSFVIVGLGLDKI